MQPPLMLREEVELVLCLWVELREAVGILSPVLSVEASSRSCFHNHLGQLDRSRNCDWDPIASETIKCDIMYYQSKRKQSEQKARLRPLYSCSEDKSH